MCCETQVEFVSCKSSCPEKYSSQFQDYAHPGDHTTRSTVSFKPFTVRLVHLFLVLVFQHIFNESMVRLFVNTKGRGISLSIEFNSYLKARNERNPQRKTTDLPLTTNTNRKSVTPFIIKYF